MNVARRASFSVGNFKRQRRRYAGRTEVVPRPTRELKLIDDGCIFQRNGQSVIRNSYAVVRHLQNPEKTIRCDAGIKVVQL